MLGRNLHPGSALVEAGDRRVEIVIVAAIKAEDLLATGSLVGPSIVPARIEI